MFKRHKKRGFTLIETLVAVAIFIIVSLITIQFVKLASGQVRSLRTKKLSFEVRAALDSINQKINGANATATLSGITIRGFSVNADVLAIVSQGASGNVCTYFARHFDAANLNDPNNNKLMMGQNGCAGSWPTANSLGQTVTDSKIKVTGLSFVGNYLTAGGNTDPWLSVTIEASDADPNYENDNKISVRTTFVMDYQTFKRLR